MTREVGENYTGALVQAIVSTTNVAVSPISRSGNSRTWKTRDISLPMVFRLLNAYPVRNDNEASFVGLAMNMALNNPANRYDP